MRQISTSYSLLTFLDELEYTEAALAADPDAASLAAAFEERIGEWDALFRAERNGRRAVTRADAVVAVRNAQLDRNTTQLAALAKAHDASGGLLKRFFGSLAPSRFIAQSLRKQSERTRDVVLAEIDKLDAAHPARSVRTPLASSVEAVLGALDARNEARGTRQIGANDIGDWKSGVNKLRTTTYAELLKIAVEKSYGRNWADTFFREDSSGKNDVGPGAEEPPVPSPTA